MIYNKLKYMFLSLVLAVAITACSNDDEGMQDDDMMMEGDMTGMDDDMMPMYPDFSGTYSQVDFMGRPGINTVLSANGDIKDMHNVAVPSEMEATFQEGFETQLQALHDAYAVALGLNPEDVDYEPNILSDFLGFDVTAEVLTTVLSNDVLEVAPDAQTVYFDGSVPIGLTGRRLSDDVIDVSLILLFGGRDGARFNGEGGLPLLVSDGVGLTADISTDFPYVGDPE